MARIRSIKPEFWVSEQLAECSRSARLAFIGMLTFSDDHGVHPAKSKRLKAEVFPMDDCSSDEVASWVEELIGAGLVAEFEHEGERYWYVTGWSKHQRIDKPTFKYPVPPSMDSKTARHSLAEASGSPRIGIAEDLPRTPDRRVEGSPKQGRPFVDAPASGLPALAPGVEGTGEEESRQEKALSREAGDSSKGSRLPRDWVLPEDWRQYCIETRPDLDPLAVSENFRDFWHGKPGTNGRKADWAATWRAWVRKELPRRLASSPPRRNALHADDLLGGAQ